jgi:predicted branched-subunit amino acid permease
MSIARLFIALTAPLLRSAPHVVAALVATAAAIVFVWVPWSLGLIIAANCDILAGARTDLYLQRRAGRQASSPLRISGP